MHMTGGEDMSRSYLTGFLWFWKSIFELLHSATIFFTLRLYIIIETSIVCYNHNSFWTHFPKFWWNCWKNNRSILGEILNRNRHNWDKPTIQRSIKKAWVTLFRFIALLTICKPFTVKSSASSHHQVQPTCSVTSAIKGAFSKYLVVLFFLSSS